MNCLVGYRVSDFFNLKHSDIIHGCIEYYPSKTFKYEVLVKVPLLDKAKDIIMKYKSKSDYIVPRISLKTYNKGLKELFEYIGLDRMITYLDSETNQTAHAPLFEKISSHCARRAFISGMVAASVSDRIICSETFEIVLNRKLLAEDKVVIQNEESLEKYPNYDLTARLINHLDFTDKLIELFSCFKIDLVVLAEETKHNLYLFDESNRVKQPKNDLEVSFVNLGKGRENLLDKTLPKFYSPLSDDCLIKIMLYLIHKKKLDNSNTDVWLFWFNRKYIKVPEPLKWKGTPTMLSNIIQHLCGKSIAATIKTAFYRIKYIKPTRKIYESSKLYKEIEQIITIAKQKK